jgi:capsid protein
MHGPPIHQHPDSTPGKYMKESGCLLKTLLINACRRAIRYMVWLKLGQKRPSRYMFLFQYVMIFADIFWAKRARKHLFAV